MDYVQNFLSLPVFYWGCVATQCSLCSHCPLEERSITTPYDLVNVNNFYKQVDGS